MRSNPLETHCHSNFRAHLSSASRTIHMCVRSYRPSSKLNTSLSFHMYTLCFSPLTLNGHIGESILARIVYRSQRSRGESLLFGVSLCNIIRILYLFTWIRITTQLDSVSKYSLSIQLLSGCVIHSGLLKDFEHYLHTRAKPNRRSFRNKLNALEINSSHNIYDINNILLQQTRTNKLSLAYRVEQCECFNIIEMSDAIRSARVHNTEERKMYNCFMIVHNRSPEQHFQFRIKAN